MCIIYLYTSKHCAAVLVHHKICYDHVQHTSKQIDNKPCPKTTIVEREAEKLSCRCIYDNGSYCKVMCDSLKGQRYEFEREKSSSVDAQQRAYQRALDENVKAEQKNLEHEELEERADRRKEEKKRRRITKETNRNLEKINRGLGECMIADVDMDAAAYGGDLSNPEWLKIFEAREKMRASRGGDGEQDQGTGSGHRYNTRASSAARAQGTGSGQGLKRKRSESEDESSSGDSSSSEESSSSDDSSSSESSSESESDSGNSDSDDDSPADGATVNQEADADSVDFWDEENEPEVDSDREGEDSSSGGQKSDTSSVPKDGDEADSDSGSVSQGRAMDYGDDLSDYVSDPEHEFPDDISDSGADNVEVDMSIQDYGFAPEDEAQEFVSEHEERRSSYYSGDDADADESGPDDNNSESSSEGDSTEDGPGSPRERPVRHEGSAQHYTSLFHTHVSAPTTGHTRLGRNPLGMDGRPLRIPNITHEGSVKYDENDTDMNNPFPGIRVLPPRRGYTNALNRSPFGQWGSQAPTQRANSAIHQSGFATDEDERDISYYPDFPVRGYLTSAEIYLKALPAYHTPDGHGYRGGSLPPPTEYADASSGAYGTPHPGPSGQVEQAEDLEEMIEKEKKRATQLDDFDMNMDD